MDVRGGQKCVLNKYTAGAGKGVPVRRFSAFSDVSSPDIPPGMSSLHVNSEQEHNI